jgi:uncharacterized damage-inducible protein DinB
MLAEHAAIAHAYAWADQILDRLVGDLSPVEWRYRDGAGHSARWVFGHVASYRLKVLEMMGLPAPPAPWAAAFARGTSDADVPEDLDMAMVIRAFHEAQGRMAARWDALTPEDLARPLGRTLPDGSDTLGGGIRFLAWHEAYHFGQLGVLRRLAGKPGLA